MMALACPAIIACAASAILYSLAFEPGRAWPVVLVALVPLLWALDGARPAKAALLAGLAGSLGALACGLAVPAEAGRRFTFRIERSCSGTRSSVIVAP